MGISPSTQRFEPLFRTSLIIIFCIYLSLVQFSLNYDYIHLLPIPMPAVLSLGVSFLLLVYHYGYSKVQHDHTEVNSRLRTFVLLFTLSMVLSLFSSFYTSSVIKSSEYISYLKGSMPTRFLYYSTFLLMLYFGYQFFSRMEKGKILKIIKVYPLSIYLLVLVGIWQLSYFFFNIPFLDINTRSYIHSVTGNSFFNFRLTSFADEPSYLGPILIDLLVLGYLAIKRKWVYFIVLALPALVILLFSFSVSAYFNVFLLVGFIVLYLMFHPKFPKKYLWWIFGCGILGIIGIILVKPQLVTALFSPVLGRMDNLFDPTSSSRIYMYVMPLKWLFDHSFISALFGYGPGSFEFFHYTKILPNKVSLATSSNNFYIDILFENGVVGLCLILFVFIRVFVFLLKKGNKNIYYFIALVEFVHISITALYRADFVTPRFWAVFLIIFLLMKIGEDKEKENCH
jgi:O-antigen ligase